MTTPEGHSGEFQHINQENYSDVVDFDGGAYTIPYLSTDPHGFNVSTANLLSRRQDHDGPLFTPDQADKLSRAVHNEQRFQGVEAVRQARSALRLAEEADAPDSAISPLTAAFENARQKYVKGMMGKVGVRNTEVSNNTLNVDVKLVSFPVYTQFAGPENSAEILDMSGLVGASMAVRTNDGRLIIQHRAVAKQRLDAETLSRGNEVYADIPGASVAGLLDATRDSKERPAGKPDPINSDLIRAAVLKEADEELGAGLNDFSKLRIVGLAHDNIKVHDEFLVLTDARISAGQLKEKSRTANRNRRLGDADFEEKFVDIEASPEAIETLLCDVQSPFPPTHSALMVACGYSMVIQTEGLDAANAWKDRLETRVAENYRRIDERVANFYQRHPEALNKVPERYWDKNVPPRNLNGYSPMYTPQEQGLPNFEDEMVRTGLMPETRQIVDEAYLFDVDGVLTDLVEHRVTEPELLDIIADKLDRDIPIGVNTGRADKWAIKNFVDLMVPKLKRKSSLANMIAIGEYGGTWTTFNQDGEPSHNKSQQLTVPEEIKDSIKELVETKYSNIMHFDGDRDSMCSIIMNEGGDQAIFDRHRIELASEIDERKLVASNPQSGRLEVEHTPIATDIKVKYSGKDLGAERFQEWLKTRHVKPKRYIVLGDGKTDLDAAEELDRNGEDVIFVFVGPEPITHGREDGYLIIHEPGNTSATLKVLKSRIAEG